MRKNINTGRWESRGLNLAALSEYGERIMVWEAGATIISRNMMTQEAMLAAEQYDAAQDYVVAIGSPTLIAILGWAIGARGKTLRMLEWDRAMQRYYPTLGESLEREYD